MSREAHVVVIDENNGRRTVKRHEVNVPVDVVTGNYRRLSNRALDDMIKDLSHEQMRRQGWLG